MFRTNVAAKIKAPFLYQITFLKIVPLWSNVWKSDISRQVTDNNAIIKQITMISLSR